MDGAVKSARKDVDERLLEEARATGNRRAVAMLPDGSEIADVTLVFPTPSARVINEAAFIAAVKDIEPRAVLPAEEKVVIVPERIDAEFTEQYLATLINREGVAYDPESGEIVSGVEFKAAKPYPAVKFRKGGEAAVLAAVVEPIMGALPSGEVA